jgi:hypothetical protein
VTHNAKQRHPNFFSQARDELCAICKDGASPKQRHSHIFGPMLPGLRANSPVVPSNASSATQNSISLAQDALRNNMQDGTT